MINFVAIVPVALSDVFKNSDSTAFRELPTRTRKAVGQSERNTFRVPVEDVTYDMLVDSVADIDAFVADNPGVKIVGAWDFDTGKQASRDYPFDETLWRARQRLRPQQDEEGNVTWVDSPVTEQTHLFAGQAERVF